MLEELLAENFGVISRGQLLKNPFTSNEIQAFVRHGRLRPIRRGWYAGASAHDQVERAARAAGALSCVSALKLLGVWTPSESQVHLRRAAYSHKDHLPPGLKDCQPKSGPTQSIHRSVDPLEFALLSALQCVDTETAVVLMDSIVHNGLLTLDDLQHVMVTARLPKRTRALLDRVDPQADSGIESHVRLRLRNCGIQLRTQVQIGGIGRVDIVVGDRLVIEIDGYGPHAAKGRFNVDRERDRKLVALGYHVIRVSYDHVIADWDAVLADILAIVRRREHWWPRTKRAVAG